MKVGIDIRSLQTESAYRGIGRYTKALIEELAQQANDMDLEFYASIHRPLPELGRDMIRKIVPLRRPARITTLWDQILWPSLLKKRKVDVFHATEFALPFLFRGKKVLTVHDLIPITMPSAVRNSLSNRLVYRVRHASIKKADGIIAVSEKTSADLQRELGIPRERIRVIHEGVADRYFLPADEEKRPAARSKLRITGPYLLYVGGFDPRKNIPAMLDIFRLLREDFPGLYLVLVGRETEGEKKLIHLVKEKGLMSGVILTGYVPEKDLVLLYQGAEALLFLSLYEGFGLPAVEAMACGTPVVYSLGTSLEEVVGEGGVGVDPRNQREALAKLKMLMENPSFREEIGEKGKERAKTFSWQNTARHTLDLYRALLEKGKGASSAS